MSLPRARQRRQRPTRPRIRRILPTLGSLGVALLIGWVLTGALAPPAGAAGIPGIPPGASSVRPPGVGITVSWLPTSGPVGADLGGDTHGSFWVTNQNRTAIPVSIEPLTAHPENNGTLAVTKGADPRFRSIRFSPSAFVAEPRSTTVVDVTIGTPADLPPGVYLVPAGVTPTLPPTSANLHIRETVVALVTFKVPGSMPARVEPSFLGPAARLRIAPCHHLPGLAPIQLATSGSEVLRVLDDSKASFYATSEITGAQQPAGTVVFDHHTEGITNDLRYPADLYFPGTYRDFPIIWRSTFLGFGTLTARAYVGYEPTPGVLVHVGVSTQAILVSPLWVLILAAGLLLALFGADRRARRQARGEARRAGRVGRRAVTRAVGSVTGTAIVAAAAFLAVPSVFFATAGVGLVAGLVVIRSGRRLPRGALSRRIRAYEGATAAIVAVGVAAVILSCLSLWPADLAVGLLAGAGVWAAVAWCTLWWNDARVAPTGPLAASEAPPAAAAEAA